MAPHPLRPKKQMNKAQYKCSKTEYNSQNNMTIIRDSDILLHIFTGSSSVQDAINMCTLLSKTKISACSVLLKGDVIDVTILNTILSKLIIETIITDRNNAICYDVKYYMPQLMKNNILGYFYANLHSPSIYVRQMDETIPEFAIPYKIMQSTNNLSKRTNITPEDNQEIINIITSTTRPTATILNKHTDIPNNIYKSISTRDPLPENTNKEKQQITDSRKPANTNMLLTTNILDMLDNVNSIESSDHIKKISEIYQDASEEAVLDDEIAKLKNAKYNITDGADDNDANDLYDSEDFSEDGEYKKYSRETKNEKEPDNYLELTDDMPEDLKDLITARNALKIKIATDNKIVEKASNMLSDELFQERCKNQQNFLEKDKQKERLAIFESDKNTYLKLKSRIKRGVIKEDHIPILFMQKYTIMNFMDRTEILNTKSSADAENELKLMLYLQNISDIFFNSSIKNKSNKVKEYIDSDDEDYETKPDNDDIYETAIEKIIEIIEPEYIEVCIEFINELAEKNIKFLPPDQLHILLSSDENMRKMLFADENTVDHTIFNKDISKSDYKENCVKMTMDDETTNDTEDT